MNCKPGDLAVVIKGRPEGNIGKMIKVLTFGERFGCLCWSFEGDLGAAKYVADSCLLPIRDPGDDAVDESKAWLPPVPLPTIEPELIPSKEKA